MSAKLRIQKVSNGQYCTAAQWHADVIEAVRVGIIKCDHLRLPWLDSNPVSAPKTLKEMLDKYPEVSAAFKILLLSNLGKRTGTCTNPFITICGNNVEAFTATNTGTPEEIYAATDAALLSHISQQKEIVRKHNLTEL